MEGKGRKDKGGPEGITSHGMLTMHVDASLLLFSYVIVPACLWVPTTPHAM